MHFDIIVVGGGIVARAIADALAQQGVNVACVYHNDEAQGQASAAAGAMLGVFSEVSAHDDPERRRLEVGERWRSRVLYPQWLARLREELGRPIHTSDGLFVIANPVGEDDAREVEAIRCAAQALGQPAEAVSPREIPGLSPQRGFAAFAALFVPGEGTVDARQLLGALQGCLERHPRVTLVDDRASRIALTGEHAVTVTLEATSPAITGRQVVLAAGAELSRLLHGSALDGLKVPFIFAGRGVSLTASTAVEFPHAIRTPNRGFACGLHVVPRADNQVYLGATNRFSTMPDPLERPRLGEINALLTEGIQEINPALQHAELLGVAIGHRPVTVDRLPLVGRTAEPRVLIASGTYRNGVVLAPLIAGLIADEVAHPGRHAEHPFSPQRAMALDADRDRQRWLRRVSEQLVATLLEPGGRLPNGRDRDLERYFHVTLSLLADPGYDRTALLRKVDRLLKRAPLDESVPLLFDLLARHHQSESR